MGDEIRGHDLVRDEDDHDLLTFSEGGIRLHEEIELTEAALRENPTDALRARLAALTEALERNTRQASASPGDTGFLNYVPPGPARPAAGKMRP
ncbi:MAG TPA: hypothetical protein VHZ03_43810 [Trebonia sp.]|nr:hypothetical protein [Trebonia sp.]